MLLLLALLVLAALWTRGLGAAALLASLVLLAPLLAAIAAPGSQSGGELTLCQLHVRVDVAVQEEKPGLYIARLGAVLQPPDPCHHVLAAHASGHGSRIVLRVEAESPPPGTFCVQVLPPPLRYTWSLRLAEKPEEVLVVVHDRGSGMTCSGVVRLGG